MLLMLILIMFLCTRGAPGHIPHELGKYSFFPLAQLMATILVSLWQLVDGACISILSTVMYSFERGSEGVKVSLDEGTLAREIYRVFTSFKG